jgi:queuine tRNA-ribosyltransferase
MMEVVGMVMGQLHRHRPTHLLGIGGLWDIFQGVRHGIDSFDCVHPTRLARHGGAIVPWAFREEALSHKRADSIHGAINLRNQRFSTDDRPLDPSCLCSVCGHLSRAYLHWMLKAKEMVALQALTLHNVATMNRIFASIRAAIPEGRLAEVEREWLGET